MMRLKTGCKQALGGVVFGLLALSAQGPAAAEKPPLAGRGKVTVPQRTSGNLPTYPLTAQRNGIAATVNLMVVVHKDGTVGDVTVVDCSSPGHGFEAAAVRAVKKWTYAPAMERGWPLDVRLEVRITFSHEEFELERKRQQLKEALDALARDSIYQEGDHLAGENGVSWPVLLKKKYSVYPYGAEKRRIESRVLLLLHVGEDGRVRDIPLAHAERQDYPFQKAAEVAARGWRFHPAEKNGHPVDCYHWIHIDFTVD